MEYPTDWEDELPNLNRHPGIARVGACDHDRRETWLHYWVGAAPFGRPALPELPPRLLIFNNFAAFGDSELGVRRGLPCAFGRIGQIAALA